jgi:hypothetical protein
VLRDRALPTGFAAIGRVLARGGVPVTIAGVPVSGHLGWDPHHDWDAGRLTAPRRVRQSRAVQPPQRRVAVALRAIEGEPRTAGRLAGRVAFDDHRGPVREPGTRRASVSVGASSGRSYGSMKTRS